MALRRNNRIPEVQDEIDLVDTTSNVQGLAKLPDRDFKNQIVWRNVVLMSALNLGSIYGIYLALFKAQWTTFASVIPLRFIGAFGVTAGAHRLWTHRAYKAKLPLKIFLMILNSMCGQNSIHEWARDHRMHHKYTETNADPHNANRGFFFSHVGWLLVKKHPDIIDKGKDLDMSDLEADGVVMFQKKYYKWLTLFCCFLFPTIVPVYLGETWHIAFFTCTILSYCVILHFTWLVNSLAHIKGNRPYDKNIRPAENYFVSLCVLGEGFHNYHHVFPWDYKTSEFGIYWANISTWFIDSVAKLGLAYDMKYTNPEMIEKRVKRTGDGSHCLWGWGDRDLSKEDIDCTIITNQIS